MFTPTSVANGDTGGDRASTPTDPTSPILSKPHTEPMRPKNATGDWRYRRDIPNLEEEPDEDWEDGFIWNLGPDPDEEFMAEVRYE